MNFGDIFKIIYADWFVFLMLMYLSFAPLLLIFKNNKNAIKKNFYIVLIILFLFYFIIPVNLNTQYSFINNVENFKTNNKGDLIELNTEIKKSCDGYLNAYKFFKIKKAFLRDFDRILNDNKMIEMSPNEISKNIKICDYK